MFEPLWTVAENRGRDVCCYCGAPMIEDVTTGKVWCFTMQGVPASHVCSPTCAAGLSAIMRHEDEAAEHASV